MLENNNLNNLLLKKLIMQKLFMGNLTKDKHVNIIFNDFIEESINEDEILIADPYLSFSNDILDYGYYEKYKGFGPEGWDCIDILVENTDNSLINKLF